MLISVDLPAPFSPSSAWTSPRRRSKSMWSLASTPGNCFVIPRSSRTGISSTVRLNNRAGPEARSVDTMCQALPDRRRGLQLPADDLLLEGVELDEPGLLDVRLLADLAQTDAPVLQVEDEVAASFVAFAGLRALDRQEDAGVHSLHRAGEDVGAEVGLVDVDADAPAAAHLRGVEGAEAARACDAEDHLRACIDLVRGDVLALRLIDEVLRILNQYGRAFDAPLRSGLVAGRKDHHRRNALSA